MVFLELVALSHNSWWWSKTCNHSGFPHHHHLFWKRPFLPHQARVRRLPIWSPSTYLWNCPFRVQTKHFHVIIHTFSPSLPIPPPKPHPCPSTFLQADTQSSTLLRSICHASPHPPCSVYPKNCTNPRCAFYPSATLHNPTTQRSSGRIFQQLLARNRLRNTHLPSRRMHIWASSRRKWRRWYVGCSTFYLHRLYHQIWWSGDVPGGRIGIIKSAPCKSCELDPVPTFLLLECLDILLPFIHIMCNSSLTSGVLPASQKKAHQGWKKSVWMRMSWEVSGQCPICPSCQRSLRRLLLATCQISWWIWPVTKVPIWFSGIPFYGDYYYKFALK